jgi:hypothetical protein
MALTVDGKTPVTIDGKTPVTINGATAASGESGYTDDFSGDASGWTAMFGTLAVSNGVAYSSSDDYCGYITAMDDNANVLVGIDSINVSGIGIGRYVGVAARISLNNRFSLSITNYNGIYIKLAKIINNTSTVIGNIDVGTEDEASGICSLSEYNGNYQDCIDYEGEWTAIYITDVSAIRMTINGTAISADYFDGTWHNSAITYTCQAGDPTTGRTGIVSGRAGSLDNFSAEVL